jgi:polysaccharide pyruvyl transferase WcaK-like protein
MIIEVKGVQFQNLGAQLMLLAIIEAIKKTRPETRLAARLGLNTSKKNLADYGLIKKQPLRRRNLDLSLISYWIPRNVHHLLSNPLGVTEGGVDAVLDASGFAYGDRWGPLAIDQLTDELSRFNERKKPYIFIPQAFGPFETTRDTARRLGLELSQVKLIYARDVRSAEWIKELLPTPREIRVVPDITIGISGVAEVAKNSDVDSQTAIIVPNIRLIESIGIDAYLTGIRGIADTLTAAGLKLIVMNHGGREDLRLCQFLLKSPSFRHAKLIDLLDARMAKGVIAASSIVISSRFHACVSALSSGVPCLSLAWSHKYVELFRAFGCPEFALNESSLNESRAWLGVLLDSASRLKPNLVKHTNDMTLELSRVWSEIHAELGLYEALIE